ncbi:MAG: hypothetical protein WCL11_25335 [Verrucomicrobiota bacterium]
MTNDAIDTTMQGYWSKLGMLRCPIGMMLFEAAHIQMVADVSARSGATLVDFRDSAGTLIAPGGRYVDFRPDTLLAILRNAHDNSPTRRVIVQNFDLGLSRLKVADCRCLWETLVNNFPPNSNTPVVLAMPDERTAAHLLPPADTLTQWIASGRAFRVKSLQSPLP